MLDSMVCELMAQIFSMADTTSGKSILLPQNSDFESTELNNNQTTVVDMMECEPKNDDIHPKIRATVLNDPRWLYLSLTMLIVLCMVWLASWMIRCANIDARQQ